MFAPFFAFDTHSSIVLDLSRHAIASHGAIVNDESSGTVSSISCSIAGARASTTASRNGTVFKLIRDISVPNSNWAAIADTPQRYDHRQSARCHHLSSEVSNRTPIQAPDTPDFTNDTYISDLSPTPRPVAEGSQPVNMQAPESDDIDAGPVEATSDLRYDTSSESARPPVETTAFEPVTDPRTDAEQPQPGEIKNRSGKPLDSRESPGHTALGALSFRV
ncbi:hypothetical protein FBULB1_11717 [Fusarium bulbicola]|nr:hypothetical protein FBULB1_11717 [Fusarium bulbicola]